MGRCPECDTWNSFVEEMVSSTKTQTSIQSKYEIKTLSEFSEDQTQRLILPFGELNRVLGQGLTKGSVVLVGGDPGIGKSTLLLQVLCSFQSLDQSPLMYVSGEESFEQIQMRAHRMGFSQANVQLLNQTDLTPILKAIEDVKPSIVVIDSVQTLYSHELSSVPGSISQVKEVAHQLILLAKRLGIAMFLVGHITKDGHLAGPKTLEHLVDTVIQFEGESLQNNRILRVLKNRFGPTNEIGVFEMRENGLKEIENPSSLFISTRNTSIAGCSVFPTIEGQRPLLVEIQGLSTQSAFGMPLRNTVGFDKNRLTMLLAVLEKKAQVTLSNQDVYINVAGGLRMTEPACDLAVACSVLSSYLNIPFLNDAVVFGEIGLTGEIRTCSMIDQRLKEAKKIGFQKAFGPVIEPTPKDFKYHSIESVAKLVDLFRNL